MMYPSRIINPQPRLYFLDHLRGFIFALLALDHSLHAYAYYWGKFWFFKDYDRSLLYDALHMHNNSIIMPMLFFIVGMWVVPSLKHQGVLTYMKGRLIKLGIPYIVGVPLIVPLLTYTRYESTVYPGISYYEFWSTIFFTERFQAGPFWVMYALLLFTTLVVITVKLFPWFFSAFCALTKWMVERPLAGVLAFGTISAALLGYSDLKWGAPWWIGVDSLFVIPKLWNVDFNHLFYLQGSRFLLQGLYFFTGAAVGAAGLFYNTDITQRLATNWQRWLVLSCILGAAYIGYSLSYFEEGAYSDAIRYFFREGGQGADAWGIIMANAPGVLLRTTLHGFFCLSQALTLLAIFARFVSQPTPFWTSLACNGYGIFIVHEVIVVWLQYELNGVALPIIFKILLVFSVGFGAAWLINDKLLRPRLRRILG